MRRVQSILVIVALIATPLALLARANTGDTAECGRLCCLPHGSHSEQTQGQAGHDTMACHHGEAGHMMMCLMKSGNSRVDYGLNAPGVPTVPSSITVIAPPNASRNFAAWHVEFPTPGFLSPPFEPPRS
jgi:hypothetical protein